MAMVRDDGNYVCYHPFLWPIHAGDGKTEPPEPTQMIGPDKDNLKCPTCGWGWHTDEGQQKGVRK